MQTDVHGNDVFEIGDTVRIVRRNMGDMTSCSPAKVIDKIHKGNGNLIIDKAQWTTRGYGVATSMWNSARLEIDTPELADEFKVRALALKAHNLARQISASKFQSCGNAAHLRSIVDTLSVFVDG